MNIGEVAYPGVSNMMSSMRYATKYETLNVIPSKIPAVTVPGIENRRPEGYPRAIAKRVDDAGLIIAKF